MLSLEEVLKKIKDEAKKKESDPLYEYRVALGNNMIQRVDFCIDNGNTHKQGVVRDLKNIDLEQELTKLKLVMKVSNTAFPISNRMLSKTQNHAHKG